MKKLKKILFDLAMVIFWIPLSIACIYGYFFIVIPLFWNHGSSYAFEAAIVLSILGLWGSFYILCFCYLIIDHLINSMKDPGDVTRIS